ncbi:MAG: hypothetical protein JWN41_673 [Thermoleophilia bacterium]|nr:hypothetical protein [Thermoleophilia bacterium]
MSLEVAVGVEVVDDVVSGVDEVVVSGVLVEVGSVLVELADVEVLDAAGAFVVDVLPSVDEVLESAADAPAAGSSANNATALTMVIWRCAFTVVPLDVYNDLDSNVPPFGRFVKPRNRRCDAVVKVHFSYLPMCGLRPAVYHARARDTGRAPRGEK